MGIRIGNVVFDAPVVPAHQAARSAAGCAALYAELLGARLLSRADWYRESGWPADEGDERDPLVFTADDAQPNLAFEWEADYHPPSWPDPDRPSQLHLDLTVPDVLAARATAERHHATLLLDAEDHTTWADVVGHPFCLFAGPTDEPPRIARIVFDCFSPRALAAFWAGLLELDLDGAGSTAVDTPERVELVTPEPGTPNLVFQHTRHLPPRWPDPAHPQQAHLDLGPGGDDAHARAERLGAIRLPYLGGGFVFADPSGHPFCLGE